MNTRHADPNRPVADSATLMLPAQDQARNGPSDAADAVTGSFSLSLDRTADTEILPDVVNLSGFRIVRMLGRGGMGVVYEAVELELNRRVALKVLPAAALMDGPEIARFRNEARAVAQLNHDNIVPVYSVGTDRGVHYYAMQLIDGQNLAQVIRSISEYVTEHAGQQTAETPRRGQTQTHDIAAPAGGSVPGGGSGAPADHGSLFRRKCLNPEDFAAVRSARRSSAAGRALFRSIAAMGAELADALAHAHEHGIIHRDIKPSNIMIDADGRPWITDFGLAMVQDNPGATRTGDVVGTLRYMSPEQASGRRFLIDHRTDVYSLGITLYELIGLRKAFDGHGARELLRQVSFEEPERLSHVNRGIPVELEIIVSRAIAKNPQDRYETAAELAADLRRFAGDEPIHARRASLATRSRRWLQRHQALAVATAAVCLISLITSVAAAAVIWNALVSETAQRERAEDLQKKSEGGRLTAIATLQLPDNPGLANVLVVKGAELISGPEVNAALMAVLATSHERKTLTLRDTLERAVDVSPDGRLAVITAVRPENGTGQPAFVIDLTTGKVLRTVGDGQYIRSAVIHPDGRRVLTTVSTGFTSQPEKPGHFMHQSGAAVLWDLDDAERRTVFAGSEVAETDRHCFSGDGQRVVLPCSANSVKVFAVANGEPIVTFRGHQAQVMDAVLSHDGRRAASIDSTGRVCLWDAGTAEIFKTFDLTQPFRVGYSPAFTSDSELLVVAASSSETLAFDVSQPNEPVNRWRDSRYLMNPRFRRAVCWTRFGKTLVIRDVRSGLIVAEHMLSAAPQAVRYSDDGHSLILAIGEQIILMNESTGAVRCTFRGHEQSVTALAADRMMNTLVSVGNDRTVRVWSVKTPLEQDSLSVATYADLPGSASVSASGTQLAFCNDGAFRTSLLDPGLTSATDSAPGRFSQPGFDAHHLVTFDRNLVRITDVTTSRKLAEVEIHHSVVDDARLIPGTDKVLIRTEDNRAFLWYSGEQHLQTLAGSARPLYSFDVDAGGSMIALGYQNGHCTIVDTADATTRTTLLHRTPVIRVLFSDDGQTVFSVDSENAIRCWKVDGGELLRTFSQPDTALNDLHVSEQQKLLIGFHSWQADVVCCWSLETGELLQTIAAPGNHVVALHRTRPAVAITSREAGTVLWNPVDGTTQILSVEPASNAAFLNDRLLVTEPGPQRSVSGIPAAFDLAAGSAAVNVYDLRTNTSEHRIPLSGQPTDISVDEATQQITICAEAWQVAVWDRSHGSTVLSHPFPAPVSVIRYLGNSSRMLVSSATGASEILEADGTVGLSLPTGKTPLIAGTVSGDGKVLAVGDVTGAVRILNAETGAEIRSLQQHQSTVRSMMFDPSGHFLITTGDDGRLIRLDLRTGDSKALEIPEGILGIQLSGDQQHLLIMPGRDAWNPGNSPPGQGLDQVQIDDGKGQALFVKLDDLSTRMLDAVDDVITGAADGSSDRVALVSADGQLVIVQTSGMNTERTIDVRPRQVMAVAFQPGGQMLATLHQHGLSIWDVTTGKAVLHLKQPEMRPLSEMSSDRSQWTPFAAGTDSLLVLGERVQIYPLHPAEIAGRFSPRELSLDESREFLIEP